MVVEFFEPGKPNGILSNFYIHYKPLEYNGREYNSSGQIYHVLKYDYNEAPPENKLMIDYLGQLNTPYKSKVAANIYKNRTYRYHSQQVIVGKAVDFNSIVHPKVEEEKVKIFNMEKALRIKFATKDECKWFLLDTGEEEIKEVSPFNSFWGTGPLGKGRNELGKLLMKLRDELD